MKILKLRGVGVKKVIKRMLKLWQMAIILGFAVFLLITNVTKVSAEELDSPYMIKVNRVFNTITVYGLGEDSKYSTPIKAMVCSVGDTGTETKLGTFHTQAKYRWKELLGNVWGQYSTRIVGGILFHSVYYYGNKNPATLATREYNKLGSPASHGCIRLTVEDARWIYQNCPVGTTVVVYDDKESPGPLGKPESIKLPSSAKWDPTDQYEQNPYKDKIPTISGIKSHTVSWGEEVDLLKGVKAKSSVGIDITALLIIEGEVNTHIAGDYDITYSITDALGRANSKMITLTVKESADAPVFGGICDKVVGGEIVIDEDFALSGVSVSCSDILLDNEMIEVAIENISDVEYLITYQINVGNNNLAIEYATIYIDREAPSFTGISDRSLEPGEIPDRTFALLGVTVSDNYSQLGPDDIDISINISPDGSFIATYEAEDEVGNTVTEVVRFVY